MIEQILSLIRKHERFFITTHMRPDGDALGSQLALGRFLEKLGKQVTMVNSDAAPYNLTWLPGCETVEAFDGSIRQRERIAEAEVIFIVDTNSYDRLGRLLSPVRNSGAIKALIDHHPNPEDWFDVVCKSEAASSTGELIYELIAAYDPDLIDPEIATQLYTAVMTDTGSFRFNNVTPAVHRIAADLLARGDLNPEPIHIALFDNRTAEGLRLLSAALESITVLYNGQVAYMVVSQRMLRETHARFDETEGFVNYVLSIEGVQAGALFSETDRGIKVSFRSKGETPVHEWARQFGGGGHRNASGAFITRPLEIVIKEVMGAAPRHLGLEDEPEHEGNGALSPEDASYLSSLLHLKSQDTPS